MKEMVGGCCVCSDERGWTENPLVYCDGNGCNVAVHQACYGIVQVPKGPWFCRKCESQERVARVRCDLCPQKEGALKRTDTGSWCHVVCALFIPEAWFGNVQTMEPIILKGLPPERFGKSCYICEEKGREGRATTGAYMQCNRNGCKQHFHVTCAQLQGLLCEEQGSYVDNVKYCGYCSYHYKKLKKDSHIKTIPAFKPIISDVTSPESTPEKAPPPLKLEKAKMFTLSTKSGPQFMKPRFQKEIPTQPVLKLKPVTGSEIAAGRASAIKLEKAKLSEKLADTKLKSSSMMTSAEKKGSVGMASLTAIATNITSATSATTATRTVSTSSSCTATTPDSPEPQTSTPPEQHRRNPMIKIRKAKTKESKSKAAATSTASTTSSPLSSLGGGLTPTTTSAPTSASRTPENTISSKFTTANFTETTITPSPANIGELPKKGSTSKSSSSASESDAGGSSPFSGSEKEKDGLAGSGSDREGRIASIRSSLSSATQSGLSSSNSSGNSAATTPTSLSKPTLPLPPSAATSMTATKTTPTYSHSFETFLRHSYDSSQKSSDESDDELDKPATPSLSESSLSQKRPRSRSSDKGEKKKVKRMKPLGLKSKLSKDVLCGDRSQSPLVVDTGDSHTSPPPSPPIRRPSKPAKKDPIPMDESPPTLASAGLASSLPSSLPVSLPTLTKQVERVPSPPAKQVAATTTSVLSAPKMTISSQATAMVATTVPMNVQGSGLGGGLGNILTTSGASSAASGPIQQDTPRSVQKESLSPTAASVILPPRPAKSQTSPKSGGISSISGSGGSGDAGASSSLPTSMEQLLERQWEQGSQFLMEQGQHFDIASLLNCLHQLRQENQRLEEHIAALTARRDHLLAVNARLSQPLQPATQPGGHQTQAVTSTAQAPAAGSSTTVSTTTTTPSSHGTSPDGANSTHQRPPRINNYLAATPDGASAAQELSNARLSGQHFAGPGSVTGTAAAGGAGQTQSPETRGNALPPGGSPTDAQRQQQQHMLQHLTPEQHQNLMIQMMQAQAQAQAIHHQQQQQQQQQAAALSITAASAVASTSSSAASILSGRALTSASTTHPSPSISKNASSSADKSKEKT